MRVNKIRLTKDASDRLKQLKGRTGIAPNILCRLGFCLSLNEPAVPDPTMYPEEDREFNRYTLLGEWDDLYVALLKQRLDSDGVPIEQIEGHFKAHLNRGVVLLSKFARSIGDITSLLERSTSSQA